jgi:hypothetical protein
MRPSLLPHTPECLCLALRAKIPPHKKALLESLRSDSKSVAGGMYGLADTLQSLEHPSKRKGEAEYAYFSSRSGPLPRGCTAKGAGVDLLCRLPADGAPRVEHRELHVGSCCAHRKALNLADPTISTQATLPQGGRALCGVFSAPGKARSRSGQLCRSADLLCGARPSLWETLLSCRCGSSLLHLHTLSHWVPARNIALTTYTERGRRLLH